MVMTNAKRVKRAAENCTTESDVFRILICTDLHVGYGERDPLRRNDSFNTLEEILQIAKERNVDFILCGKLLFSLFASRHLFLQPATSSTKTSRRVSA